MRTVASSLVRSPSHLSSFPFSLVAAAGVGPTSPSLAIDEPIINCASSGRACLCASCSIRERLNDSARATISPACFISVSRSPSAVSMFVCVDRVSVRRDSTRPSARVKYGMSAKSTKGIKTHESPFDFLLLLEAQQRPTPSFPMHS